MPDPKPVPVPNPKRSRNTRVAVYRVVNEDGYTISPLPEVAGPYPSHAAAKAAVRGWLSGGGKLDGAIVFLRILERVTPKVESVTKVTL